jgi:hypothetical protein
MLEAQLSENYNGVDNYVFIKIAKALAEHVKDLDIENILPNMFDKEIVNVVVKALN